MSTAPLAIRQRVASLVKRLGVAKTVGTILRTCKGPALQLMILEVRPHLKLSRLPAFIKQVGPHLDARCRRRLKGDILRMLSPAMARSMRSSLSMLEASKAESLRRTR